MPVICGMLVAWSTKPQLSPACFHTVLLLRKTPGPNRIGDIGVIIRYYIGLLSFAMLSRFGKRAKISNFAEIPDDP